jgi:hypothetical protein
MEKHHIEHIEKKINELHKSLIALGSQDPVPALIPIIHKPGWTSVAEEAFVTGILDAMLSQTKTLSELKQVLLSGVNKVALNPQPLPP